MIIILLIHNMDFGTIAIKEFIIETEPGDKAIEIMEQFIMELVI